MGNEPGTNSVTRPLTRTDTPPIPQEAPARKGFLSYFGGRKASLSKIGKGQKSPGKRFLPPKFSDLTKSRPPQDPRSTIVVEYANICFNNVGKRKDLSSDMLNEFNEHCNPIGEELCIILSDFKHNKIVQDFLDKKSNPKGIWSFQELTDFSQCCLKKSVECNVDPTEKIKLNNLGKLLEKFATIHRNTKQQMQALSGTVYGSGHSVFRTKPSVVKSENYTTTITEKDAEINKIRFDVVFACRKEISSNKKPGYEQFKVFLDYRNEKDTAAVGNASKIFRYSNANGLTITDGLRQKEKTVQEIKKDLDLV